MRKITVLLVSILLSSYSYSQERLYLDLSNSCSFNGAPISGEIYGFSSSNEAISIIDEIVGHIGLKRNFKIQAGNVPNAAATIKPGNNGEYDRYILYSQSFMSHIINESNSYWAAIGIMAHEVAHHLNGHTLKGPSRPPTELEADEFAGFVLYKMGATLNQAQSMFKNRTMYQPYDSSSHPATSARLEAVAVGYQKSKEKSGNITVSDLPKNRTPNNTSNNYPNTDNNYPNTNSGDYYPNTTSTNSTEEVSSADIQYVNINVNNQNMEFQILKDKRLLMVTAKAISTNGDQTVNASPIGSFLPYNYQGQSYYSLYFGAMDPVYGTISYYTFFIYSNKDIYIAPYNNPQNLTKVGNLKFNWRFSSSGNTQSNNTNYNANNSSNSSSSYTYKYDKLYFKNECTYPIKLLIRYKNLNSEWETKGWYTIESGENAYIEDTKNTTVYWYAEDATGKWSGEHNVSFNGTTYGFKEWKITDENWGKQVKRMTCN